MTFLFQSYNLLKKRFRNCWIQGQTSSNDGIIIYNRIVFNALKKGYSIKELNKKFLIDNSDLVGLTQSKLVTYLDPKFQKLYRNRNKIQIE